MEWCEAVLEDGTDEVVDSIGRVMDEGGAFDSHPASAAWAAVPAKAWSGTQGDACAKYLFGYRVCSAHGVSVEGSASRIWQRERGS